MFQSIWRVHLSSTRRLRHRPPYFTYQTQYVLRLTVLSWDIRYVEVARIPWKWFGCDFQTNIAERVCIARLAPIHQNVSTHPHESIGHSHVTTNHLFGMLWSKSFCGGYRFWCFSIFSSLFIFQIRAPIGALDSSVLFQSILTPRTCLHDLYFFQNGRRKNGPSTPNFRTFFTQLNRSLHLLMFFKRSLAYHIVCIHTVKSALELEVDGLYSQSYAQTRAITIDKKSTISKYLHKYWSDTQMDDCNRFPGQLHPRNRCRSKIQKIIPWSGGESKKESPT